ncbi:MAG: PucR family transcriptional regulator ligand-binding domain-containing protein [Bacillota bacterium]|nr:PucR family transcriptional regulator ligand-binding domain-containing protein [Bacillota bacterium]MDW7678051.1 PucR family transcriptional regulator ligand-binding domain-containing protein [Bacillota bacterium]
MQRSNGISIEDVMKMECMQKCRLIAGFGGIRNTVSKVNIMADPDVLKWVEAGELLLTTAYSFKKDEIDGQKDLIRKSAELGLAGIGIKIQPYLKALHPEMIQLANKLNFPIIELHDSIPFSEIIMPIFQELFDKQASLLKRIEKIHERLMNVMLNGGGIREILKVVSDNLHNPVLIKLDTVDDILVEFGRIDEEVGLLLLENCHQFLRQAENRGEQRRFMESVIMMQEKHISRMVMPLLVKNRVAGYLMTWAVETPLGGFDLSVLEAASTTMALEVLKQMSVRDVENRYRTEFFEDLISMDLNRKENALKKAALFKLSQDDYYVTAVLQIERDQTALSDDTLQQMNWMNRETDIFLRDHQIQALAVSKTDSLNIVFFSNRQDILQELIDLYGRHMMEQKRQRQNSPSFRLGIGRCYKSLREVDKSYADAVRAIRHGPLVGEEEMVYFEQLGIYKILCQPSLAEELERFYQTTLQPLVEYDARKSTELLKTLETYYQMGGNLRKTADVLFTHYNTTLYRMDSIQRVTGMDLSNHKDRLNLEVAIKIRKLLNQ